MPDPLLVLHVDVKVADHDDTAIGANALLAAAELGRLHVALHDVDAVFLVKGDAGDFVEAHDVVLAHESALACGHVDEHACDGGLAARYQVRVGRDLLKQVAFARPAWSQFDHVVVAFHKGHHA